MLNYIKNNRLGTVTVVLSLSYMFIGLPSQILRIMETQSVREISLAMFSLLAIQSVFWVFYGLQKKDWFVVTANTFGAFFAAIIIVEYFLFR